MIMSRAEQAYANDIALQLIQMLLKDTETPLSSLVQA